MKIIRNPNNPIIHNSMKEFKDSLDKSINGPSIIKVPSWVKNPLGKYYLYFSHHNSPYISLAFSNHPFGPWKIYKEKVLYLKDTPCEDHISSPDVHILDKKKKILMYFHGKAKSKRYRGLSQLSFAAISDDGLFFESYKEALGPFYLRVFRANNKKIYAFAKNKNVGGLLLESKRFDEPFKIIKEIIPNMRHVSILKNKQNILVFYSKIGDVPERILCTYFSLNKDPINWDVYKEIEVIYPVKEYEGVDLELMPSSPGKAIGRVRELRDPEVFSDDSGEIYLYYTNAGESGISVCKIEGLI